MPLHHTRDHYRFTADAQTLDIEPGPKPITLRRAELEQLGFLFRDDYQIRHMDTKAGEEGIILAIMNSLTDALARCKGQKDTWMHRNLQRAIVLIGGMHEGDVVKILEQEGV